MLIDTLLKNLEGITWSNEFSMYYVLNSRENFTTIFDLFRGKVWINAEALFPNKKRKRDSTPQNLHQFKTRTSIPGRKFCPISYIDKLELKGYAFNTAKTYIACFESFINYYNQYKLLEIDEFMIRKYLQYLISKKFSDSYINQSINSIKFYYEIVEGMPNRFYAIERPRKKAKLPKVLSKEDIINMIACTENIKHKCIISLLYASGLRRIELINLELRDIDSKRMVINIRDGKGNKDRVTILGESVIDDLRKYYKLCQDN